MKHKFKTYGIIYLLYAGIISLFYKDTFFTFFQGDEWHFFSEYLPFYQSEGGVLLALHKAFFEPIGAHFTPLLNILHYYEYLWLGVHFERYVVLSLLLHTLNAVLVMVFARRITGSSLVGLVASIFFALSSSHYQAVTWMATYLNLELSTALALVSLLLFDSYLQNNIKRYIVGSALAFIAALLIKEGAIFALFVFPFVYLLHRKKLTWGDINKIKPLWGAIALYIPFRILGPRIGQLLGAVDVVDSHTYVWTGWAIVLFRVVVYPIRGLVQAIVPSHVIMHYAEILAVLAYPPYGNEAEVRGINFLTFSQGAGTDIITLCLFFIIAIVVYRIGVSVWKSKRFRVSYVAALAIVCGSMWPLIMIGFAKSISWWGYSTVIDSRHLYTASIGVGILAGLGLVSIADMIARIFKSRFALSPFLGKAVVVGGVCIVWLSMQTSSLASILENDIETGQDRKHILSTIRDEYPELPKKAVIYIESDSAYYGFAAYIVPFQINFGRTLLIWYAYQQDIPYQLVSGDLFTKLGIEGEGFDDHGDYEFGYYVSAISLREALVKGTFEVEDIIAFSWDGTEHRLTDITHVVQADMRRHLAHVAQFEDWIPYSQKSYGMQVRYPSDGSLVRSSPIPETVLDAYTITYPGGTILVEATQFDPTTSLSEYVSTRTDSDGELVGPNYTFETIEFESGMRVTTVPTTTGTNPVYYFPVENKDVLIRAELILDDTEKSLETAKQILKFYKRLEDDVQK